MVSETDYLTLEPRVLVDLKLFSSSLITIPVAESFNPRDVCLVRRRSSPSTMVTQEMVAMLVSYARMTRRLGT
jgi:LysR family transcriptional regulator of abg operon